MAPSDRLRAYSEKEYDEIIHFPVELVDRDGVVRRYSYEESLAVYHRRIQSAPWRYGDEDLIRAEVAHCFQRIEQIKRSYKLQSEEQSPQPSADPRRALGEGFEVLRAHYDVLLSGRQLMLPGRLPLDLTLLQHDSHCRIYHVGFGGDGVGHLLYVYPYDEPGDDDPQARYEAARSAAELVAPGRDVERLLLAHDGAEAGFLITGVQELPTDLEQLAVPVEQNESDTSPVAWLMDEVGAGWWADDSLPDDMRAPHRASDAFDRGLDALREDQPDQAVEHFRQAVEANPYHRDGYLALLAILDRLGRHSEAEMFATLAVRQLGNDGLLRYRQGVNLVRQGRLDDALVAFDDSARLDAELYQPRFFAAHVALAGGAGLDEVSRRLAAAAELAPDEDLIIRNHKLVRSVLRWRGVARVALALAVAGAAWGYSLGNSGVGFLGVLAAALLLLSGPLAALYTRWALRSITEPDGD